MSGPPYGVPKLSSLCLMMLPLLICGPFLVVHLVRLEFSGLPPAHVFVAPSHGVRSMPFGVLSRVVPFGGAASSY